MPSDDTHLSTYRYELPDELIAKRPLERRSSSRLLVLRKGAERPEHRRFFDLVEILRPGDVLVVNDTSVLPARLFGEKAETGGKVEVLLGREEEDGTWIVLLSASKTPRPGTRIVFGAASQGFGETFFGEVLGRVDDEPGAFRMRFEGDARAYAKACGHVPLPPYLERDDDEDDRERYQTVYADPERAGAAAAPTAGLHFDEELLAALKERGVELVRVTLHVGPGTFLPVRTERITEHKMHAEAWTVSEAAAKALNEARARGSRIVAVGTTSLRTLESCLDKGAPDAAFAPGSGLTRLFIRPGYRIRSIDALITNFHLPESTLLMLVAAISGRERILRAYEEAVRERYRFFSYGDACYLEVIDEARP